MNTTLSHAYQILFLCVIFVLAVLVLLCLLRAIKGPTIADRIIAINMIGTLTMMIIGILAVYLKEGYLVDVCLVYAMLSFLAVIVLTKIYNGVHKEKKSSRFKQLSAETKRKKQEETRTKTSKQIEPKKLDSSKKPMGTNSREIKNSKELEKTDLEEMNQSKEQKEIGQEDIKNSKELKKEKLEKVSRVKGLEETKLEKIRGKNLEQLKPVRKGEV